MISGRAFASFAALICCFLAGSCLFAQDEPDSLIYFESYFALDEHRLAPEQKRRLDSLFQKVPLQVVERVEIFGHTDSLAGNDYNLQLSRQRVQSLLQYLVFLGLDPRLVYTDHFGEERPKYSAHSEAWGRNRRVEMNFALDLSRLPQPEARLRDQPFAKGDQLRLPGLVFVGNQPIPMWQSFPVLEELWRIMKMQPDLVIELQGHVCCANDEQLSVERARMVYHFLRENGIATERMRFQGFSNRKPLLPERDEEARALNRRVEVLVLNNSERREAEPQKKPRVALKAPVLNLIFAEASARLAPSGDFMLGLLAEMMVQSEGLYYQFVIYDNIGDAALTRQRSSTIYRTLRKKGVDPRIFKVRDETAPEWMTTMANENSVMVEITEK